MKKIAVLTIFVCLVLAAGCTGTTSAPAAAPTPTIQKVPIPVKDLSVIKSGNYSLTTAIDHIEVDSKESGKQVNIYLRLKNTGNESIRLVWYSRLTDKNGLSYGGVGVSHGGSGAATFIFNPDSTGTMRDYVDIPAKDYAALKSGGAVLEIAYADQKNPLEPISGLNSTWTLEPVFFP
jgi:hypothetical protein